MRLTDAVGTIDLPRRISEFFVESLKAEGVDMSRVSISKSYAVLVGVETYQRSIKKIKGAGGAVKHQKDKLFNPEKVNREEEEEKDTSESAEKERQYLEKMKLEETDAKDRSGGGVSTLLKRFTSKD